jgi:predicted metal-dependent peptidase
MKPAEKLRAATGYLILHHPFITTPLLRLKLVPTAALPTAGVDGRSIFYNEAFVAGLTSQETIFLLAHEVLHVALGHHLRRGDRDVKAWNAAADYVINLLLQQAGFTVIEGALLNPDYAGWSTERVYKLVMGQAQQALAESLKALTGAPGGAGSPSGGAVDPPPAPAGNAPTLHDYIPEGAGGSVQDMMGEDGTPLSNAERSQKEGELSVTLRQALQAQGLVQGVGASTSAFSRAVESRPAGFDARTELADFLTVTIGRDDYAWSRPNPRYLSAGVCLPSLSASKSLVDVIVAIDTSGSVTPSLLSFMAGVCEDLFAAYPQTVLRIVYCDSEVRSTEEITIHDGPVTFSQAQGGGGTRFNPVFEWVTENGYHPTFLLYMTDLAGPKPEDPGYPVVWLAISSIFPTPPFGRRIDLSSFA